jgi:hypothetical protein
MLRLLQSIPTPRRLRGEPQLFKIALGDFFKALAYRWVEMTAPVRRRIADESRLRMRGRRNSLSGKRLDRPDHLFPLGEIHQPIP